MMRSLVASSLLACSYLALSAAPASACRPAPCANPPVRVFEAGRSIPGNLAYFKVLEDGATLTLETKDGTPIAASTRTIGRDKVFAPDVSIPENTEVRLKWSYVCERGGGNTLAGQYDFSTRAAAELQVIAPTVRATSIGHFPLDGRETASTTVQLWAGDDVTHLYETTFTVDGGNRPPVVDWSEEGTEIVLRSPCEGSFLSVDTCGVTRLFPLGEHTVRAEVHVIGANSDPAPVEITTETTCELPPAMGLDGGGRNDAGVSSRDAAVQAPPINNPDAGLGVDGGTGSQPTDDDDGCSVARGRFDGAWLLLGLALFWRRKRSPA